MSLTGILGTILELYGWVILAAILLSWFQVPSDHPVGAIKRGLAAVTEPLLRPIRRVLPPVRIGGAGLDLSPLVLLLAVRLAASFLT
ncbi:MAG: YggT family protein [Acidimicrobiia bacterium]